MIIGIVGAIGGAQGAKNTNMNYIKTALDIDRKKIVHDGCMVTFCGVVVDLMNPKSSDILIQDIAHGLAYNCRWNGHTKSYFSVAEHCCMMYDAAPAWMKRTALFHDAEEAYWGDIIKPVKNLLSPEMREKMREMRRIIFDKFSVSPICEELEALDFSMLQWDFENLILKPGYETMPPDVAESQWMYRFGKI